MHNSLFRDEAGKPIGIIGTLLDITERKRTEEALRVSEEKYRNIFNNAPSGIFRSRISDGKILESNDRHARMHGYDDTRRFVEEFVTSEHYVDPRARDRMLASFKDGELKDFETCLNRRDESLLWVLISARIYPEQGYIEGVVTDITEHKQAEEALYQSEQRFRQLAENIQEVFWMTDPDRHGVLYVSPAYETVWGRPARALCEDISTWVESLLPEDRPRVLTEASRQSRGEATDIQYRIARPDGSIRWIRDRGFPVRDETGRIYRIAGIAQDITEYKEAEEALQRSERYFRSLIENSSDIITILDDDGTIRYQSSSIERILGYNPGELIGRNALGFVHPEDEPRIREVRDRLIEIPGQTLATEFRYKGKDGAWHALEATATNLLPDPVVAGLVINARDITERKRAEEASLVFARSLEQSREGLLITDAEVRITFANKAAEELVGCSTNDMLGRRPDEVLEVDPRTRREIADSVQRQRSWSGLAEGRTKQGRSLVLEMTSLLISDERDVPIATVSLLRDARQTRRLESLQQMAEVVAGTRTTDETTISRLMSHLPELVSVEMWAIYVHDPEHQALTVRFFSEAGREMAEASPNIPLAGTLQGEVFRTGEIVFSPDVSNDYRFTRSPLFRRLLPTADRLAMKATCILPIRSVGEILGTLNVSDRHVRTFTPEELAILKTLASQIGLLLTRQEHGRTGRPGSAHPEPTEVVPIVAESEAMRTVLRTAHRLAATEMPIVILGPTGAGKGHLAKYIHSISPRSHEPFLAVNCACLDGDLILSELFGHERGAFTGAVRQQKGCFELANGGTLLLDEVVELPPSAQAKLLQLVETQQFRRLGGQQTITTDVRVICTTNADVRECVRSGKMRQDLYYRLNAGEIYIPPLCERPEDIDPLAQACLRTQALTTGGSVRLLSESAIARLRTYPWPGNVRELQNIMAMAATHGGRVINLNDLHFTPVAQEPVAPRQAPQGNNERDEILEALRRNRWNRSLAAEELGMHRNTLRNRMRKHNITE
jgi:PAS domain S-box-containing protein